MKAKSIWTISIVAAILVLLAAIVGVIVINNHKTVAPEASTNNSSAVKYAPPKACDILTLGMAQKIDAGVTSNDTPSSDVSSDSISVSNCNYYDITTKVNVGLLVRGAKNQEGADSNSEQFKNLPSGALWVSGYGDKAYWDPAFGQLNILKSNNWYILSSGLASPKERTLDETKKLADAIIEKL